MSEITKKEYEKLDRLTLKISELKDSIMERRGIEDLCDVQGNDVLIDIEGAWAELHNALGNAERYLEVEK